MMGLKLSDFAEACEREDLRAQLCNHRVTVMSNGVRKREYSRKLKHTCSCRTNCNGDTEAQARVPAQMQIRLSGDAKAQVSKICKQRCSKNKCIGMAT